MLNNYIIHDYTLETNGNLGIFMIFSFMTIVSTLNRVKNDQQFNAIKTTK